MLWSWKSDNYDSFKLKEFCRHGKAGSVNTEVVAKECARIKKIYEEYPPKDNLNFDESGLFGLWVMKSFSCFSDFPFSPPPDCGIVSKQISWKKSNKFWITVGFMCNATGSKRLRNGLSFTLASWSSYGALVRKHPRSMRFCTTIT